MCTGHVAHRGQMRNAFNILVRKPDEKGPHGRHRRRCENDIRMM